MAQRPSRSLAAGQDGAPAAGTESADVQALLGPPPLVPGEDEDAYAEILSRVRAAVGPKDVLEEFWVRDVVDLSWEAVRLRRMKANVLTAATHRALEEVLAPILNKKGPFEVGSMLEEMLEETPAHKLAARWYRREPTAVDEVESILKGANLSMDVVTAKALGMSLDVVERIERMVMNAEGRRNAVLREVARHRAVFADGLRRSSGAVRDAEFTEVPRK